jgi:hypothetical protein
MQNFLEMLDSDPDAYIMKTDLQTFLKNCIFFSSEKFEALF